MHGRACIFFINPRCDILRYPSTEGRVIEKPKMYHELEENYVLLFKCESQYVGCGNLYMNELRGRVFRILSQSSDIFNGLINYYLKMFVLKFTIHNHLQNHHVSLIGDIYLSIYN